MKEFWTNVLITLLGLLVLIILWLWELGLLQ